jgi:hypothetical protein
VDIVEGTPERVLTALGLYLGIAPRRSLRALVQPCNDTGLRVSIATLKRWSTRYRWQDAVAEHERRVAQEFESKSAGVAQIEIAIIKTLHERIRDWIQIDPFDPNLTKAERRRAFVPSLRDYEKLIRLEGELLDRLGKPPRDAPHSRMGEFLAEVTPEETAAMLKTLTSMRHNLPVDVPSLEQ